MWKTSRKMIRHFPFLFKKKMYYVGKGKTGAIVGLVIALILLTVLIVVIIVVVKNKKEKSSGNDDEKAKKMWEVNSSYSKDK